MKFKPLVSEEEYGKALAEVDEAVAELAQIARGREESHGDVEPIESVDETPVVKSKPSAQSATLAAEKPSGISANVDTRELKTSFETASTWVKFKAFFGFRSELRRVNVLNEISKTVERARAAGLFDVAGPVHDVSADFVVFLYRRSREQRCSYEELNAIVGAIKTASAIASRVP